MSALRIIVGDERRRGRIAGLAGLAGVACWVGALMFTNATTAQCADALGQPTPLNRAQQLFDAAIARRRSSPGDGCLSCAGLILVIAIGVYLYTLVRTRRPQLSRWMLWSAAAGASLAAGATVFGAIRAGHTSRPCSSRVAPGRSSAPSTSSTPPFR